MRLILPFPPSINHYWRHVGSRVLISEEGRKYRAKVCDLLSAEMAATGDALGFDKTDRLAAVIEAFVPDDRRRDLDNIQKPLLDALQRAKVFADDYQIDDLRTIRRERVDCGLVIIAISIIPQA